MTEATVIVRSRIIVQLLRNMPGQGVCDEAANLLERLAGLDERLSTTECNLCKRGVRETCQDGACRACHKSCSWEDCTSGTYAAAALKRLGHSDESILEAFPNADLEKEVAL